MRESSVVVRVDVCSYRQRSVPILKVGWDATRIDIDITNQKGSLVYLGKEYIENDVDIRRTNEKMKICT